MDIAAVLGETLTYTMLIVIVGNRLRQRMRNLPTTAKTASSRKESLLCRLLAGSAWAIYAVTFLLALVSWPDIGWMTLPLIGAMIWAYRYLPTPLDIRMRLSRHLQKE